MRCEPADKRNCNGLHLAYGTWNGLPRMAAARYGDVETPLSPSAKARTILRSLDAPRWKISYQDATECFEEYCLRMEAKSSRHPSRTDSPSKLLICAHKAFSRSYSSASNQHSRLCRASTLDDSWLTKVCCVRVMIPAFNKFNHSLTFTSFGQKADESRSEAAAIRDIEFGPDFA